MGITHELMAKTGTYTDRDGNEKARWTKCGVIFEKDGRMSIKLEAIPAGAWDGWLSAFEPRPREDAPRQQQSRPQRSRDDQFDQDVPF